MIFFFYLPRSQQVNACLEMGGQFFFWLFSKLGSTFPNWVVLFEVGSTGNIIISVRMRVQGFVSCLSVAKSKCRALS